MRRIHGAARAALVAVAVLAAAACSRGVAIESEPGPAYTVEVVNELGAPAVVSYSDGAWHLLGTVQAGDAQRFVITNPAQEAIQVRAVDEDGRQRGVYDLALSRIGPNRVVLTGR